MGSGELLGALDKSIDELLPPTSIVQKTSAAY